MAPSGVQSVLALEIEASPGETDGAGVRQLIREMSLANPLWGAPRIHGELLKLGIAIGQTSVAKYIYGAEERATVTGLADCQIRRRLTS